MAANTYPFSFNTLEEMICYAAAYPEYGVSFGADDAILYVKGETKGPRGALILAKVHDERCFQLMWPIFTEAVTNRVEARNS